VCGPNYWLGAALAASTLAAAFVFGARSARAGIALGRLRFVALSIAAIGLALLGVFDANSHHFGWGLLPGIAASYYAYGYLFVTSIDALIALVRWRRSARASRAVLTFDAIALAGLAACIASFAHDPTSAIPIELHARNRGCGTVTLLGKQREPAQVHIAYFEQGALVRMHYDLSTDCTLRLEDLGPAQCAEWEGTLFLREPGALPQRLSVARGTDRFSRYSMTVTASDDSSR
jgi:hypothetical protein